MNRILIILPIVVYLALMLGIAVYTNRSSKKLNASSMENYFIGGRSMGGMVLGMTLIATYTSASSFIGGPGVAYSQGVGWVLLAMIQVPTAFLTLGVLGKKFAIVSRRINAVTVTDYLRARYENDFVVIFASASLLIFMIATMVAQFIGGARLFQAVSGLPYIFGLVIFGITVIVYTTVGGFKAVALTDAIQGIIMLVATVFIFIGVVKTGGGIDALMGKLVSINPELITPFGVDNFIGKPFILSFWVLVGIAVLGLPQTSVRCMGFKDSKSMHNAMIIGTFVVGFLMLGMTLVGVLGRALMPNIAVGDLAVPTITMKVMPPILAGIFIAGPLAAIMSTVDSLLIMCSAAIIKDLYMNYSKKELSDEKLRKMSFYSTAIIGLIVFAFSLNPPDLIVWINLFAFGGLEAAFLWPTIMGLYWKQANAEGALASMLVGVGSFFFFSITKTKVAGTHAIVPTIVLSLVAFIIGSYVGEKPKKEIIDLFWE